MPNHTTRRARSPVGSCVCSLSVVQASAARAMRSGIAQPRSSRQMEAGFELEGPGEAEGELEGISWEAETEQQSKSFEGQMLSENLSEEWRPGESEGLVTMDPYASIRSALSPEFAGMKADEITLSLGRMPATVVLHQMLNLPETRQAITAALLGRAARRSVRINGAEMAIPVYFRLISRLCREVAEQTESEV